MPSVFKSFQYVFLYQCLYRVVYVTLIHWIILIYCPFIIIKSPDVTCSWGWHLVQQVFHI